MDACAVHTKSCECVWCVCIPYLRTLSVSVGLGQATSCPLQKGGPRPLLLISSPVSAILFSSASLLLRGGFVGEGEVERTSKIPAASTDLVVASTTESASLSCNTLEVSPPGPFPCVRLYVRCRGGSNAAAEPHRFVSFRQAFHQASIWPLSEIQGLHQSLPLSEIRGIGPWAVAEFSKLIRAA